MNILKLKKKRKHTTLAVKSLQAWQVGVMLDALPFKYTDLYNKRWTCE